METELRDRQRQSTLLALPQEIRNLICEPLLVHRRPVQIASGQSDRRARVLLDVCRQLKNEFSGPYYHSNIFTCRSTEADLDRQPRSTDSLICWLRRIGPRNRAVLCEIQMRVLTTRTLIKDDVFRFIRNQNARLAREVGWMPLTVVRIRFEHQWLDALELNDLMVRELHDEEVDTLERTGNIERKGPDLRVWKRDHYDPVIDKFTKPGERQLSEYVCPATWRYHARSDVESAWDKASTGSLPEEQIGEGCLSGGLKILMAKVRRGRGVFSRSRNKESVSARR